MVNVCANVLFHPMSLCTLGLMCKVLCLCVSGSPKRRQFQRQRAASESMDQEDSDAHHIDLIQYIASTQDATYHPCRPSASACLLPPSSPPTPPPSLGRYL